jgi:hypothetical protein
MILPVMDNCAYRCQLTADGLTKGGKMFKKVLIVLLVVCFLLGMATKKELENVKKEVETTTTAESSVESEGTEKYVPKVIIDAKWGDGRGEFGVDAYKVNPGPRNLVVDGENLYIYDWANCRIYKYDVMGKFKKILTVSEEERIVNFTVKNDTLYGVIFPGLSEVETIKMIDTKTGEEIKTLQIKLSTSHYILDIHKSNGKIVVTRGAGDEEERFSLDGISKEGETIAVSAQRITKVSERFSKINKTEGELVVDGQKFLISKVRGSSLFNAWQLAEDKNGNVYISVWSNNPVGSPSPRVFEEVFKYSSTGKLLASVLLPKDKIVSGGLVIGDNGDIFYLYATGEIIEKNWKLEFLPGKVQVIKWELQK